MESFVANVHRCFDFLVSEYGFTYGGEHRPLPELGNSATSVRYDAPHLFVWVHLDPPDVEVLLFVKVHTSVLRPGGRRSFTLQEVLRHQAPDMFSKVMPDRQGRSLRGLPRRWSGRPNGCVNMVTPCCGWT